ncbi:MAG: hypothetical protein BroJett031_32210 [Betaproteobacteria bacterium]|nr:MAG: hypothetical protein BroJett031_32210 [Betaproteobacteria bacterium]
MSDAPSLESAVAADRVRNVRADDGARTALALGLVGALGEELLARLVGSSEYRVVHVGVTQPIGSAAARFRPWVVGQGVVIADDAYVCLAGPETFVPAGSPLRAFAPGELLAAARIARDCGARRLVVVAPLDALLQMSAAAATIASSDEIELARMGFESVLIVRPTAADDTRPAGRWIAGLVRAAGRTLADIMLPTYARALSVKSAARAIVEAARTARSGVTVLGARDLLAIVEAKWPQLAPKRRKLR